MVTDARVRFQLWDGFESPSTSGAPLGTIVFKNRRALFSWVWDPDLNFGETYMFGAVDLRGDLVAMLHEILPCARSGDAEALVVPRAGPKRRARRQRERAPPLRHRERVLIASGWIARWPTPARIFRRPPRRSRRRKSRRWIGCAGSSRLKPGERVIEAGCGWGGLALHMVRRYGRDGSRDERVARADRLRARSGARGGARRSRRVRRGRLSQRARPVTTRSCRSACSSTSARSGLPDARGRDRSVAHR